MSRDYRSDEGEEITLWMRCGDLVENKPIKVKKLEQDDRIAFEETAVKADRIGFMFDALKHSKKLKEKYFNWLCIMFCNTWNKLAPHIALERKKRFKNVNGDLPPPVCFAPYFEKLVYDIYDSYRKWAKEDAKILCLNPQCKIQVDMDTAN